MTTPDHSAKPPGSLAARCWAVACPTCDSQPHEPCTQPTNTSRKPVSWFHYSRERAASK